MKALLEKYKSALIALAAVGLLLLLFLIFSIPCPIKYITGISCAGCGMTRAWLSVLRLDLALAFEYHPLFWALPIAFVAFVLLHRFPRSAKITLSVLVTIDLIVYLIRLIDPSCAIVVFKPSDGLIYRIIHALLSNTGIL